MKRLTEDETTIARPRFHTQGPDGLFVPIPFLFVTHRMLDEIQTERQLIIDMATNETRARQQKLLERYDPGVCASAFDSVLRMMNLGGRG